MAAAEAGSDDAVALQLLEYTRSTAAAVADAQQPEGTAGDMDAVLESLTGLCADADELEEWARSQFL
jgi:outer membrane biogenesis lipoprotein LolB